VSQTKQPPANPGRFIRQFVLLCRQLDLLGRELIAVDGTRIKAVNNKTATSPTPL
jgi:transposase